MGDETTTSQTPAPDAPPPATAGQFRERRAAPKKSRVAILADMLFNLVLIGSIGFIGFMVWEQDKAIGVLFEQQYADTGQRDTTGQRLEAMQGSVDELASALALAREEITALAQGQAGELERLGNELAGMRLRINTSGTGASREWQLAEAASLLRLAQQHLVVARNARTAQALYIAADDVLKGITDPAVFAVREILAGELAALRAVPQVDVQEIYLQLGAVAGQVSRLQATNDLANQVATGDRVSLSGTSPSGTTAPAQTGFFARLFARLRATIDNYFVVRRRDAPIQPLLTPGQEAVLVQSVRLQIEQARTALLRGEQGIYSASLEEARTGIERYLAGPGKAGILSALASLGQRRVVTEPPPLTRTLAALEQVLAQPPAPGDDATANEE